MKNGAIDHESTIVAMTDTMIHRGPDADGYYQDEHIALGFRRLSIIDIDGGNQPITSSNGRYTLVFNGEIYNFAEIREDLIQKGQSFKTRSDSEVLLQGYIAYGRGILDKLRGMYSFVIWDRQEKELFGARDIFGIKPFYYYHRDGDFFFASEAKAFLAHPDFVKELDRSYLGDYLCYEYLPCQDTFFKNVRKLLPGFCFAYKDGVFTSHEYFKIQYNIDHSKSFAYYQNQLRSVLRKSVSAHRISDVEVGCFLSGGIDSSVVAYQVGRDRTGGVKTFSAGYAEKEYSELDDAGEFAQAVGLENIQNTVTADMFFDSGGDIQYHLDEPLSNPSQVPLYFLCKNAAKYVKVVLSGEGADELFGGYSLFQAEANQAKFSRLPAVVRRLLAGAAKRLPHFKGRNFLLNSAVDPIDRYRRIKYIWNKDNRNQVLRDNITSDPKRLVQRYWDETEGLDSVSAVQYADMKVWMVFDILQKADRMSMAHSLELRVPFLDREVLSLALKIPPNFRTDGRRSKIILRAAAEELPPKTRRMKKVAFVTPLAKWLRQDKYYEMVRSEFESGYAAEFFKTDAILDLLEQHKKGKENMMKIWGIYSFLLWYKEYFIKR
ncbi:MAG: asparagine synthase (glutamine-hydrolyzing) [Oscillospiraceae bacterium]|nr:asparagine synthase (glutamine-hydrolyzing) [Oscillospiraceae bacterium]